MNDSRGFTLIELLVVIAIMGILSSVVLASISDARGRARDAVRLTHMRDVHIALEQFFERNGHYPIHTAGWAGGMNTCTAGWFTYVPEYIPGIVSQGFMQELPQDPRAETCAQYLYRSNASGSEFKFLVHNRVERGLVEQGTPTARCPAGCPPTYCTQHTFGLYSPGAACW